MKKLSSEERDVLRKAIQDSCEIVHGGVLLSAKRGPKPLHGENMQAFHFRMTTAQREKLDRLGGAKWIRSQILNAKEAQ